MWSNFMCTQALFSHAGSQLTPNHGITVISYINGPVKFNHVATYVVAQKSPIRTYVAIACLITCMYYVLS